MFREIQFIMSYEYLHAANIERMSYSYLADWKPDEFFTVLK